MNQSKRQYAKSFLMLALLSPMAVLAQPGQAQLDDGQLAAGQTVADRAKPDYSPQGIRMGSFIVHPSVELSETYTDNLFFQDVNPSDDFVTQLAPRIDVQSDWNNHDASLQLGSDIFRHVNNSAENSEDYWLTGNLGLDASRQARITLGADLRHGHEGRGSADAVNGLNPTETDTGRFDAGFEYRPGRYFLTGALSYNDYSFDNVRTSTGAVINNQDRYRTEQSLTLTAGYEIQPGYNAFVRLGGDSRDYDSAVDDNGFNRDSDATRVELGVEIELSGLVNGEISLGQVSRDYDDARFSDTNSLSTQSQLFWQLSPLTTVVFDAQRDVNETTTNLASGFVGTSVGVAAAHELKRNILLEASLSYTQNEFQLVSRTDDVVNLNFDVTWDVSRNVYFAASLAHDERNSDAAGFDYQHNSIGALFGYRL